MNRQLLSTFFRVGLSKKSRLHRSSAAKFQSPLKRLSDQSVLQCVRGRVAAIVGEDAVAISEAARSHHGQDEGPELGKIPDLVTSPANVQQVSEVCTQSSFEFTKNYTTAMIDLQALPPRQHSHHPLRHRYRPRERHLRH
jgi:hypothetical protein